MIESMLARPGEPVVRRRPMSHKNRGAKNDKQKNRTQKREGEREREGVKDRKKRQQLEIHW